MNNVTSLTQKGQVVIPQWIRLQLGLTRDSKLNFQLDGTTIIVQPVMTIDEAYGMISMGDRGVSKKQYKQTIRKAVISKFEHKS